MAKSKKILEVLSSGDLVLDQSARDINENYFEENTGIRTSSDKFIFSRDFGSKAIITSAPIRPNAFKVISNAVSNGGLIRLTVTGHGYSTGTVYVDEVTGTVEANCRWTGTVIDANTIDLVGSTFTNAYVSGGIISQTPITIYKSFIFYDKVNGLEYPVVFGYDSSSKSRIYVYGSEFNTAINNNSNWWEATRFFTALINDTIGVSDTNFDFDTLAENGVTYTGQADFVNNYIVVNTTQSNETVFITDSTATNLTVDTVVGSNGLGWANNDVIQIYRFPCFKYNWNDSNGTSPHIDFHFIEDQRKLNILYTNSSTPQVAYQGIQLMKRNERSYFPAVGTQAVAQLIYGTPTAGQTFTISTGVATSVFGYSATPTIYGQFSSVADVLTLINNSHPDVTATNVGSTITITTKSSGTIGNGFYLIANNTNLQVSNVSQGATSSGTRYFEGGVDGSTYLRTLPAGWYCESDFGIINPYFISRGSTSSPYSASIAQNIYDQLGTTSNRKWLVTNSRRTTDVALLGSEITQQRVYLNGEYGASGYQKSDVLMQLFIESNNTSTGNPVSEHYFYGRLYYLWFIFKIQKSRVNIFA